MIANTLNINIKSSMDTCEVAITSSYNNSCGVAYTNQDGNIVGYTIPSGEIKQTIKVSVPGYFKFMRWTGVYSSVSGATIIDKNESGSTYLEYFLLKTN